MAMLADVKAYVGLMDTSHDLLVAAVISGVLDSADEYMGVRYSDAAGVEDHFDGGVEMLFLRHVNVRNLTLYVDGDEQATDTYDLYSETGKIKKRCGAWQKGNRIIRVTYDGGWSEDALPSSLRMKLVKQVGWEFRRRKDPGLQSVTFPDGSVNKFDLGEWLADVEVELNRRRRLII